MATTSYLPETAGGMVAAASFSDEARAADALKLLRGAGVRRQDLSVVAGAAHRAVRLAGNEAWTPWKNANGVVGVIRRIVRRPVPAEVRRRYGAELRAGAIVLVAAADGQPPDTLAALFSQAGGESIERWWQAPCALFAPPELAGPF